MSRLRYIGDTFKVQWVVMSDSQGVELDFSSLKSVARIELSPETGEAYFSMIAGLEKTGEKIVVLLQPLPEELSAESELERVVNLVGMLERSNLIQLYSGAYGARIDPSLKGFQSVTGFEVEPFVPLHIVEWGRSKDVLGGQYAVSLGFGNCSAVIKEYQLGRGVEFLHNPAGLTELALEFVQSDLSRNLLGKVSVIGRKPELVGSALKGVGVEQIAIGRINDSQVFSEPAWPRPNWRAWVHVGEGDGFCFRATADNGAGTSIPIEWENF